MVWEVSRGGRHNGLSCQRTSKIWNEDVLPLRYRRKRQPTKQPRWKGSQVGVLNANCKFTIEQIYEIRQLFDSGTLTCREIANRFKCSDSYVSAVGNRTKWTCLPERE